MSGASGTEVIIQNVRRSITPRTVTGYRAATNGGDDTGDDDDEGESETEVNARANLVRDVGGKPSEYIAAMVPDFIQGGPESGMRVGGGQNRLNPDSSCIRGNRDRVKCTCDLCVQWRRDKQWNEPEHKMLAEYDANKKAAGREWQRHSRMRDGGKIIICTGHTV
ncbi:hypothetical protein DFH09DRAFT_1085919 [Mycena vulgaris]|nr:hypothetical protein DFH09DRAFT_1085919 [Mycena vulgaris]